MFGLILLVLVIAALVYAGVTNAAHTEVVDGGKVVRTIPASGDYDTVDPGPLVQETEEHLERAAPTPEAEAAIAADPGLERARCWRFWQSKKFESGIFKTDLGKARISQYWCAKGRRIVYIPRAEVSHETTGAGSIAQWNDKGVQDRSSHWVRYRGRLHGAHSTTATVHFENKIGPVKTKDEYLRLKAVVRSDGTAN